MPTLKRISASLVASPSRLALAASLIWIPLAMGVSAHAQTAEQESELATKVSAPVIPQQVRYSGKLATRTGDTVEAVFSIYAAPEGGEPLWTETQKVAIDMEGSYTVLLGSVSQTGVPQTIFQGGAARWLGVSVERAPELERVLLSSVPYAMKSADSQALAGHPAGDFVTQGQLSEQFSQFSEQHTLTPATEFQPLISGTITGSGTAGSIPEFTGANTIGNSEMVQVGTDIGINEPTPVATLDVNGTANVRGTLSFPPLATATTAAGQHSQVMQWSASAWSTTANAAVNQTFRMFSYPEGNDTATPSGDFIFQYQLGTVDTNVFSISSNGLMTSYGGLTITPTNVATSSAPVYSPPFELGGSSYSSTSSSAVHQNFAWQVVPTGNDTSTPSSNLALLYGSGFNPLAATGLSISPAGVISWAPGQTFPITGTGGGTITGITTSSPLTGSGTSGSVALGLNETTLTSDITPGLESTFNGIYPQLTFSNTFTTGQIIEGSSAITGTNESGPMLTVTNSGDSFSSGITVTNGGQYGAGLVATASSNGDGIEGFGTQTAGSIGVLGALSNSNGFSNSYFLLESDDGLDAGVWADGATGQEAALIATGDDVYAGIFYNDSATRSTITVLNNNSGGTTGLASATTFSSGISTVIRAGGPGGICGINQTGNLSCTGQVKSVVSTQNGTRQTETYAVQSSENWIEDYGSGQLSGGRATVTIETAFAETVNTGVEFHVFLTPGGDCKGLYVTNKTGNSFEVHELGGGTSSIPFDYKIVAKRRGFETQRLVDVTERMRVETEAATKKQLAQPLPRNHSPIRR